MCKIAFVFLAMLAFSAIVMCGRGQTEQSIMAFPDQSLVTGPLVETISVPSESSDPVFTRALDAKKYYIIQASGVFSYWDDRTEGADAYYDYDDKYTKEPLDYRPLEIDDQPMYDIAKENGHKIEYNSTHIYETIIMGTGKPLKLHIWDIHPGSYIDNHGSLEVKLFASQDMGFTTDLGDISGDTKASDPFKFYSKLAEARSKTYGSMAKSFDLCFSNYVRFTPKAQDELTTATEIVTKELVTDAPQLFSKAAGELSFWYEIFEEIKMALASTARVIRAYDCASTDPAHCNIISRGLDNEAAYKGNLNEYDFELPYEFSSFVKENYGTEEGVDLLSYGDQDYCGLTGPGQVVKFSANYPHKNRLSTELAYMEFLCLKESEAWKEHDVEEVKRILSEEGEFLRNHLNWIGDFKDNTFCDHDHLTVHGKVDKEQGYDYAKDQTHCIERWGTKYYYDLGIDIENFISVDQKLVNKIIEKYGPPTGFQTTTQTSTPITSPQIATSTTTTMPARVLDLANNGSSSAYDSEQFPESKTNGIKSPSQNTEEEAVHKAALTPG